MEDSPNTYHDPPPHAPNDGRILGTAHTRDGILLAKAWSPMASSAAAAASSGSGVVIGAASSRQRVVSARHLPRIKGTGRETHAGRGGADQQALRDFLAEGAFISKEKNSYGDQDTRTRVIR